MTRRFRRCAFTDPHQAGAPAKKKSIPRSRILNSWAYDFFSPGEQRRERFFGLKGRFCQPRPQAWDNGRIGNLTLKGSFNVAPRAPHERPLQGQNMDDAFPRPSAWAGRIGFSGRKPGEKSFTALPAGALIAQAQNSRFALESV
jgi:hypothetical protein